MTPIELINSVTALVMLVLVSYQTRITGYTDRGGAKGATSGMTKIYPGF